MLSEIIRVSDDSHLKQGEQSQQVEAEQDASNSLGLVAQNSPLQATYFLAVGSNKVMRCSSLLAYMLLHVEVPAVIRLAIKCAKVFFKLVDLRKLKLFYAETGSEKNKGPLQLKGLLDSSHLAKEQSDFLTEAFKTIGAKITNSRHLADRELPSLSP